MFEVWIREVPLYTLILCIELNAVKRNVTKHKGMENGAVYSRRPKKFPFTVCSRLISVPPFNPRSFSTRSTGSPSVQLIK